MEHRSLCIPLFDKTVSYSSDEENEPYCVRMEPWVSCFPTPFQYCTDSYVPWTVSPWKITASVMALALLKCELLGAQNLDLPERTFFVHPG